MKKQLLLPIFLLISFWASAQSFSDDFESYSPGDYLAKNSAGKWTTYDNLPGSAEDVKITDSLAHSGKNSIRFKAAQDTPSVILLPLGGNYQNGTLDAELWLYILPGKSGSISSIGNGAAGKKVWPFRMQFHPDGTLTAENGAGETMLKSQYTPGKWLDVKISASLNNGSWKINLDGQLKGTVASDNMLLSSLEFYAGAEDDMFVDDVSYSYTPYATPKLNVAIVNYKSPRMALLGYKEKPSFLVRNLGTDTITNIQLQANYGSRKLSGFFTNLHLLKNDTISLHFLDIVTLSAGDNAMQGIITAVNGKPDVQSADDTFNTTLKGIVPAEHRVVITEEGTGTWCPWCPRGTVYMAMMTDRYFPAFQGIAVHTAVQSYPDPMADDVYESGIDNIVSTWKNTHTGDYLGYPCTVTDRKMAGDPLEMEQDILERFAQEPYAYMVNGATYDQSTGKLKVSVTAHFLKSVSAEGLRLACVIAEDQVKGTTFYYSQQNGYAGGRYGPMGGFEKLGGNVPAKNMVYQNVGRAISPNFYGADNIFPQSISSGGSYTFDFTFDVAGIHVMNVKNLHIIGMLLGKDSVLVNGSTYTYDEAIANGFTQGQEVLGVTEMAGPDQLQVYPNPASDFIQIHGSISPGSRLLLYDITGRKVMDRSLESGADDIRIPLENIPQGMYMLTINSGGQVYSTKVMVRK